MPRRILIPFGFALLATAASLSGCGRKGPLEAPPKAIAEQRPTSDAEAVPVHQRTATPGGIDTILDPDTGAGP